MKSQIVRMFDHLDWADRKVLNALQSSDRPPEKAIYLYAHILAAEKVWLARLNERDTSGVPIWPELQLEQCEKWAKENREGYKAFFDSTAEDAFTKNVAYRNSKGEPFQSTVADILTHVCLHGSYHRGQIASLLRGEGHEPASTDYIFFVREQN